MPVLSYTKTHLPFEYIYLLPLFLNIKLTISIEIKLKMFEAPFSQTEYLARFLTLYKCSSVVNQLRAASHLNYRSDPSARRTQERDAGSKGRRQQGSAPPNALPRALRWAAHP